MLLIPQALIFVRKVLTHEDTLEDDCGGSGKETTEINCQIINISSLFNLRQAHMT